MRFLHLADIHLDTLFLGRSEELRRRLREASREALSRGLALARERDLDAVLLAGDLFDSERLSLATERFLAREFAAMAEAGIPVFHAAGNHDPSGGGGRVGAFRWPVGVHRFRGPEPETVVVHRGDRVVGTVTGAGHEGPREHRDLSRAFRPPGDPSLPAVALLHTQVGGASGDENHDRYAPSELSFLREAGFDYWALGHIHLRQELSALPGIRFPGNTQGRSPRETGAKGGLVVELPGRGVAPAVEFVELAPLRWELLTVTGLEEARGVQTLVDAIERNWREARSGDPGLPGTGWLVRLELEGPTPLHRLLRDPVELEALGEEVAARIGALEVEVRTRGVRPALDAGAARERQDAAGSALRLAHDLAREDGPSPSAALGIDASDLASAPAEATGDPEALDRYLRTLLQGGSLELLARFQEGGEG
jgi:DNA repair protein SbcD/Mre11